MGLERHQPCASGQSVAVVGSGISGLSAAWLLSQNQDVVLYEALDRIGGHANTIAVETADGRIPVDTGFIVYNPKNYPNLTALFDYLGVETARSNMSFSVSLDDGAFEYGGASFDSLFAQRRNAFRPAFWSMLRDLVRFYRTAPEAIQGDVARELTLGDFLIRNGYRRPFIEDHLLPMAGAIWSAAPQELAGYPAAAFIRFFQNHGLLELRDRPQWRTVVGGSREYVLQLHSELKGSVRTGAGVSRITRVGDGVLVEAGGDVQRFDRVLIATHADEALAMLSDASADEKRILGAFRYTKNTAILHSDETFMPRRKKVWSSWNYLGRRGASETDVEVTYWMNRLQPLVTRENLFVTLNPKRPPAASKIFRSEVYTHPLFDMAALRAQGQLSQLQGRGNTWFCGAYFGSGFHEDGLGSGLAAAEAMGSPRRPWRVQGAGYAPVAADLGAAS